MLLQIEGFDSLADPATADMLSTKFQVTNPTAPFTIGGTGGQFVTPGRNGGKSFRPPNQSGGWTIFHVYPKLRAAGPFTDTAIFGFAHRISVRNGNQEIPVCRVILDDASEGMELIFHDDNTGAFFRWEIHRGFSNASDAIDPGTGSTILGQTANNPYSLSTWVYIEFRFKCADTGGIAELRIDGVPKITFSGDTKKGTGNPVAMKHYMFRGNAATTEVQFDDAYWLVEDGVGLNGYLGDVFVETIQPTGDGNQTDWTPNSGSNHFDRVDDVGFDGDTTYVSTNTVSDTDLFTYPNLSIITTETILGVQVSSAERNEAAGTNNLEHIYRSVTPLEFQGAIQGLVQDTPWEGHYQIWEKDPETTLNWVRTDIDAGEFGIKLVS